MNAFEVSLESLKRIRIKGKYFLILTLQNKIFKIFNCLILVHLFLNAINLKINIFSLTSSLQLKEYEKSTSVYVNKVNIFCLFA